MTSYLTRFKAFLKKCLCSPAPESYSRTSDTLQSEGPHPHSRTQRLLETPAGRQQGCRKALPTYGLRVLRSKSPIRVCDLSQDQCILESSVCGSLGDKVYSVTTASAEGVEACRDGHFLKANVSDQIPAGTDSATPPTPPAGCLHPFCSPGVWFVRQFSARWGARYGEAARCYAEAYRGLPDDLRPECIVIVGDTLSERMAVDALLSESLPAVLLYRGAVVRANNEADIMSHPVAQLLRGMNNLQNLEEGCLRISGWKCPTLNKVSDGEGWEWGLGIESPDLNVVTGVTECVCDRVGGHVIGDAVSNGEANVSDQIPRTQDVANTTDSPERLSASVLFALGLSWWFIC